MSVETKNASANALDLTEFSPREKQIWDMATSYALEAIRSQYRNEPRFDSRDCMAIQTTIREQLFNRNV